MTYGIVYHEIYGFGVITSKDKIVYKVYFYNDKRQATILDHFLYEIPDNFVEHCIKHKFEYRFNNASKYRAKNFIGEDCINNVKCVKGIISADITGTSVYRTTINITNYHATCTCPVDGMCKHECALFYYLARIFNDLNTWAKNLKLTNVAEPDRDLRILIDLSMRSQNLVDENLLQIVDHLVNNLNNNYLLGFFESLFTSNIRQGQQKLKKLAQMVLYNKAINDHIYESYDTFRKSYYFQRFDNAYYNAKDFVDEMTNGSTFLIDNEKLCTYYYVNYEFENVIKTMIQNGMFDFISQTTFRSILDKITLSDKTIDLYVEMAQKDDRYYYIFNAIYNLLGSKNKLKIIDANNEIEVNLNDIQCLQFEEMEKFFPRLKFDSISQAKKFLNEAQKHHFSNKSIGSLIMHIYEMAYDTYEAKNIQSLVKKMANGKYFAEYLAFDKHRYRFRYWYSDAKVVVPKTNDDFDSESFFAYFSYELSLDIVDDEYKINYFINDPLNNHVLTLYYKADTYYQSENNISFDDVYSYDYDICCYINEKEKEVLKRLNEEGEKKVQEIRFTKMRDRALSQINEINSLFSNRQINLLNNKKANLQYFFIIDDDEQKLFLKIGINKMYVVKDAKEFVDDFIAERTKTYGKDLVITHRLDNINQDDQKTLKLLLGGPGLRDYDRKNFYLNDYLLLEVLNSLKGKDVSINNTNYRLRLNELTMRVYVDKDYILHLDNTIANANLIFFNNYLLAFDNLYHTVDICKTNSKILSLYRFAYCNNNFNISSIKKELNENVHSNYPGLIEFAQEIKDEFKLSEMTIQSYFDYKDKTIVVENKYFIDGKMINNLSKLSNSDATKKYLHDEYLKNMGFDEDGIMSDDAEILAFFYMNFDELKQYCEVYLSESIKNKSVASFTPARITIKQESNIMQAFLQDSEYSDEELESILKSIKKNKKYVLLKDNRIVDISNKDSADFYETVDDLNLDIAHLNQKNTISVVESLKAFAHEDNCDIDDYLKKIINDISHFQDAKIPMVEINGELRDYQKQAFKWLKILSNYNLGGILADDMGLGKTIEIIALLKSDKTKMPSLIVCPKAVVYNWIHEINKFAPELEVKEIFGGKNERLDLIENIAKNKKAIYVTSYDTLRNDIDDYKQNFAYLIVDEAQYIKNVKAQKTMSVKNIKAQHYFALTGTPIENNIIDLWSIFDLVLPGYLENVDVYKNKYTDEKAQEILAKRIAPFVLRRTKQNVLKDLPDKYERILTAEMNSKQKKIYEAVRMDAKSRLDKDGKAFDVLPYLMKLRQICVDPALCVDDYKGGSGKMDVLQEIVDEYIDNGHRILIFSQFVSALNVVEKLLQKKKIPYFIITGDTPGKKRVEIADSFNNNSKEKICLISLKAGGTGLNLIGADTVIHLDPWWNVSAENQASDRSYRIGQTKNVEVIKLICENSIEQRVIELQNMKKDLIDKLISNDESSINKTTLQDIKFILD